MRRSLVLLLLLCAAAASAKNPYAGVDMQFLRINLSVDPTVKYIKGVTTHKFGLKQRQDRDLPLLFELSSALEVKDVKHGDNTLKFKHQDGKLLIYPENVWAYNDSVTVHYEGKPASSGLGSVVFSKHGSTPIFWTLSEPDGSKDWHPCRQINTDKYDSVQVIVSCPERYRSASNGVIISETVANGIRTTNWMHRHRIAFYLVAVAVSEYDVSEDYIHLNNGDSVLYVNYYFHDQAEHARKRFSKLIPAFKMLCDTFGAYPFADEKYGQAQFLWSGGMENQTMTFLSGFGQSLMIHELAHQWFGNTITCSRWTDVWINEGFAEFCEGLAEEVGVGQNNEPVSWRRRKIFSAASKPLGSIHVRDTTSVWEIFDTRMTYDKGCMLLHMLRTELGDQMFFGLLKYYIKHSPYRDANCTSKDFFKLVNEFTGKDFTWFFDQWYYGRGTPIYRVVWQQNDDNLLNIRLEQRRSDSTMAFFRAKVPLMISGYDGESVFVRVNNTYENQYFTLDPGFEIASIAFDPYADIISWGSSTKQEKLADDGAVKIRHENSQIHITLSNPKAYSRYFIKTFDLVTLQSGKIGNDGSATIDLRRLPAGEYYIALEGEKYFSKRISVSKKNTASTVSP